MNKMPSKSELKKFMEAAVAVASGAGRLLLKAEKGRSKIQYKGRVNLVTGADLASEDYIVKSIGRKFPDHSILAEEGSSNRKSSNFRWVIDPLDGTTNYAHGFPFYCVSIALEFKKDIVAGAVYDPQRDEMFHAFLSGGAFLNGKRIHVSNEQKLEKSLLATGFPYDIGSSRENNLKYFNRFARKARGIRRAGSAALDLCYLACGRFDGFWELKLHPWDTAAGKLIVEGAGGRVTDFEGRTYSINGKYILASNGKIHGRMKKVLRG